jgi:hypothetical protein
MLWLFLNPADDIQVVMQKNIHCSEMRIAVVAQMVEHQLPKLRVVGSIPIYRSWP